MGNSLEDELAVVRAQEQQSQRHSIKRAFLERTESIICLAQVGTIVVLLLQLYCTCGPPESCWQWRWLSEGMLPQLNALIVLVPWLLLWVPNKRSEDFAYAVAGRATGVTPAEK